LRAFEKAADLLGKVVRLAADPAFRRELSALIDRFESKPPI